MEVEQPTVESDAASIRGELGTAAEHATRLVPVAAPGETAAEALARFTGERFDCADDVAVLDGNSFAGIVPIEILLAAPRGAPIATLMEAAPTVVYPGADQEHVAHQMVERGEASVAVVDSKGRFQGLIPPDRMLAVMVAEHEEDLARIGGYTAGSEQARHAAEERVGRRLAHRMPWLAVGLAGSMLTAALVSAFEGQLADHVLLAVFIPAVVYLSDAVGTQTEAILIRGLAVGIDLRMTARRELASGLLAGVGIGAAFGLFVLVGWGEGSIALAVALALLASCAVASAVAMALPLAFRRFGADPAFGAGPLATVLQDLVSILVYLGVAAAIVG